MRDSTRRRLSALGIPRERQAREPLAELFPPDFRIPESSLDEDAVAELLVHLAGRGLVRLPAPRCGHVCRFYHDRQELLELLVPYFGRALLEGRFCVWIASGPVSPAEAAAALRGAVPDFDRRAAAGQVLILGAEDFYLGERGRMRPVEELLRAVGALLEEGARRGFPGVCGSGDASWAARDPEQLEAFLEYEGRVDESLKGADVSALCTYPRLEPAFRLVPEVLGRHRGT